MAPRGKSNRKKKIRHGKKAYKNRNVVGTLLLSAQAFQADLNPIRQVCSKLLFRPLLRRYISLLDLNYLSPHHRLIVTLALCTSL